jgi:predicted RNase H-like nuclease (RuvC/YqgF family)
MQARIWNKPWMIVAALCLAGLPGHARQQQSSSQQSGSDAVADAARKARVEKKTAAKPKKVYTDDDVKQGAPAPAAAPSSSTTAPEKPGENSTQTAGAKGEQKAAGEPKTAQAEDPNGEKAWRKRFRNQHDKIAKAERELDILQRESEKAQTQYYSDPQKALTQQNSRSDINEKNAKIDAKKKEIAQLKQELDDLEDQLRKSGGDTGWAR